MAFELVSDVPFEFGTFEPAKVIQVDLCGLEVLKQF